MLETDAMKAAVVETFGVAPSFRDFREPEASESECVVTVRAAALSPIVKALAAGKHYASSATAGFVPGVDGVGTDSTGRRVYFLFPKAPFGSMAEKSLVANEMMVPVPENISDLRAAAVATAGLASWIALSRRARVRAGETVMVIGATGSAGSMALQTARYFGASKVIAVGRSEEKLARLDADVKIALNDSADETLCTQFGQRVDVVLDFVWGEPATRVLKAATQRRGSPGGEARLRYVQLGTLAGDTISLRGDMLRSTGVELMGSGIGSVAVRDLLAGAGELLAAAPEAGFNTPFESMPLRSIADAWNGDPDVRYILAPASN
jgi:NADPH:quinone reductase-like Zn-dependent oxidoreductase